MFKYRQSPTYNLGPRNNRLAPILLSGSLSPVTYIQSSHAAGVPPSQCQGGALGLGLDVVVFLDQLTMHLVRICASFYIYLPREQSLKRAARWHPVAPSGGAYIVAV